MSNTWANPTIIAKEVVREFENNCVMANLVNRVHEQEWAKSHNGWKPGSSIRIKAPVNARVKDSATMDVADLNERYLTLSLDYRKHVAYAVTADEMTYNAEKNIPRFAKAAGEALAEYVDYTLLGLYKKVANQVGTPGQTPKDFLTLALANATLADHSAPSRDIRCILNPTAQAYIADSLKALYNPAMTGPMVERAKFSTVGNMDCFVSQNVNMHTCGTAAGLTTPLIYGTVSEGAETLPIDTNGSWTLTMTAGDLFTIDSVYGVNPITGISTGKLRQFACHTATLDNGTDGTVYPIPGLDPWKIYSASAAEKYLPYQTIDALPADNANVRIVGSAGQVYPVNLAFHKDAFALAMVPLAKPDSVSWGAMEYHNGIAITVVKAFDVTNYQEYIRFDILFAADVLNPFWACRIAG